MEDTVNPEVTDEYALMEKNLREPSPERIPDFDQTNDRQFVMTYKEYTATQEKLLYPPRNKG